MKHSIYYFLCVFFVLSCNEKKQKEIEETEFEIIPEVIVDNLSEYPKVIDSLGLHDLYDSAKWRMYLLHATDTPKYDENFNYRKGYVFDSTISFAKLDLRLDSIFFNDTGCLKLYFEFYISDTQSINSTDFNGLRLYTNGIEFDLNYMDTGATYVCYLFKESKVGIFGQCKYNIANSFMDTTSDPWYNPLQPDVIEFLNTHKHEIHPWLYREGLKRGVIKEVIF